MDSQKGRVVEKNYICTVVSHHGNLPQNHGLGFFFVLFLSFGPTSQHHFQVQETERVIISMTDFFFPFFFLAGAHRRSENPKMLLLHFLSKSESKVLP